jgi:hypothetical protein
MAQQSSSAANCSRYRPVWNRLSSSGKIFTEYSFSQ